MHAFASAFHLSQSEVAMSTPRAELEQLLGLITSATHDAMSIYEKSGHGIPSLNSTAPHPFDAEPTTLALKKNLRILEGACDQLCAILSPPGHTLMSVNVYICCIWEPPANYLAFLSAANSTRKLIMFPPQCALLSRQASPMLFSINLRDYPLPSFQRSAVFIVSSSVKSCEHLLRDIVSVKVLELISFGLKFYSRRMFLFSQLDQIHSPTTVSQP